MGIEWRGPIPQSNYTVGRNGGAVDLIVDHWTVLMFERAIRRFKDPASRLSARTTRLQRWLAKAIRSVFPNAALSGPDADSGQPFKA